MGFKISSLVRDLEKEISFKSFSGKKVAIDAFNTIYQFIAVAKRMQERKSEDEAIAIAILGFLNRNINFLKYDIKPIYAFEKSFKTAAKNEDYTCTTIIELGKLIILNIGMPTVYTKGEGEAQASYIVNRGDAYACVSNDYDTLLFGAERVALNLTHQDNLSPRLLVLDDVLGSLDISHDQIVDMALLIGCDFTEGVKGVGAKRALKLVREYGSIEGINEARVKVRGYIIDIPQNETDTIRSIFKSPQITEKYTDPVWKKPNYATLTEVLLKCGCSMKGIDDALYSLKKINQKKQKNITRYFGWLSKKISIGKNDLVYFCFNSVQIGVFAGQQGLGLDEYFGGKCPYSPKR